MRRLEDSCTDLSPREAQLLKLHIDGWTNQEVASAWKENVKVIRVEVNAIQAKIRYRVKHQNKSKVAFENNGT
jgi:DNA-binding NarL/FixJ family response regulator